MSDNGEATRRPLAFIFSLGLLGGATLIATVILSHRGPLLFLPYAAIVLAAAAYLRLERVRPFARRLTLSVGSFMVATLVAYVFVAFFQPRGPHISVLGHAWRLGFMLLIGSILGSAVAQLTATNEIRAV